jgi:UDP-N-acetylmuramyl pentapeptide phosphotransferase/UDP-N-acetylglucosamine-1-phosphate transferase
VREFLLVLCVTAAVTYLLTGPVRKFAIVAGAMPEIRERDVHREPTPRMGGIAMFGGMCAGLLVASKLTTLSSIFSSSNGSDVPALLAGASIMWVIGVLDDKWGVDALVKLGAQMVAAGVMVWRGLTILWLPVPGIGAVSIPETWGTLLAVALVVMSVNAVNFIDGLDGLAAGMVCIAALAFFVYAYRLSYGYGVPDALPATLFSVVLVGMCVGFLPHNLHPARIFMGDSGALLLGLVLSVSMISLSGRVDPAHGDRDSARRPAAGGGPADLGRKVAFRGGQAASAPPVAGDRAFPQPGSNDHVFLGGTDRIRHRRLLRGPYRGAAGEGRDDPVPDRHPGAAAAPLQAARPPDGGALPAAALPPNGRGGAGRAASGRGGPLHPGRGTASQDRYRRPCRRQAFGRIRAKLQVTPRSDGLVARTTPEE